MRAAVRAENSIKAEGRVKDAQSSTEGSEEQNQVGSSSRRASTCGTVPSQGGGIRSSRKLTSAISKAAATNINSSRQRSYLRGGTRCRMRSHVGSVLWLLGKEDEALGNGNSPSTSSFVQAQKNISRWKNITLDVEGDTDESACELLHEKIRDCRRGKNVFMLVFL